MNPDLIGALTALLDILVTRFGPNGTLWLLAGGVLVLGIRRWYLDWRDDKLIRAALDEKERTITRIATQERELRMALLISKGMPEEIVRRIVAQGELVTESDADAAPRFYRRRKP